MNKGLDEKLGTKCAVTNVFLTQTQGRPSYLKACHLLYNKHFILSYTQINVGIITERNDFTVC